MARTKALIVMWALSAFSFKSSFSSLVKVTCSTSIREFGVGLVLSKAVLSFLCLDVNVWASMFDV